MFIHAHMHIYIYIVRITLSGNTAVQNVQNVPLVFYSTLVADVSLGSLNVKFQ